MNTDTLVVIETHPIQYHAPVYRCVQETLGIPVSVIYGSDFSVAGYQDQEFGASFAWDVDLLSGYDSVFLSHAPSQSSVLGMRKALKNLKPAAILLVGYSPRFHQAAILQALRFGVPILFRGETTDHARPRNGIRQSVRDVALRFLYKRCARLLYVGKHSLRHFDRLGVAADRLHFSPYCVGTEASQTTELDRSRLRQNTRERLSIGARDIVLLFSGKLSQRKGPDLLVSSVKSLPMEVRDRLVILFLGSGAMKPALEDFARRAPGVQVRFVGFQNQKQLSPYYHAADLLVLPSRHGETWGLVVNEALHHGLPCVVSQAVGCAPDLIDPGVTGEVFENDSADSLGGAILRGLKTAGQSDIRIRCREKVSCYSVERAAQGIANAYWSVVGTGNRAEVQWQKQD